MLAQLKINAQPYPWRNFYDTQITNIVFYCCLSSLRMALLMKKAEMESRTACGCHCRSLQMGERLQELLLQHSHLECLQREDLLFPQCRLKFDIKTGASYGPCFTCTYLTFEIQVGLMGCLILKNMCKSKLLETCCFQQQPLFLFLLLIFCTLNALKLFTALHQCHPGGKKNMLIWELSSILLVDCDMHDRLIDQSQLPGQEQQIWYALMTVYLAKIRM